MTTTSIPNPSTLPQQQAPGMDLPDRLVHESAMSASIATTPAGPTTTHPLAGGDPHAEIDRLRQQLAQLTTAHETLRAGIQRELTTLVARRWVRPSDAEKILTRFGLPKLPHCYTAGADVAVTLVLCAPDVEFARRGALRLIADDLRNLRDARRQAPTRHGVDDPQEDTIHLTGVTPLNRCDPADGRPLFRIRAFVRLAVHIDSPRACGVWPQARRLLRADLARLRLVRTHPDKITGVWVTDLGPCCRCHA